MKPERFLTADQQATVVDAVRLAEKRTSGEIRIHIDADCPGDPVKRAQEVFGQLGMHRTQLETACLSIWHATQRYSPFSETKASTNVFPNISGKM